DLQVVWESVMQLSVLKPGNTGGTKDTAKATRAAIKSVREVMESAVAAVPSNLSESDDRAFDLTLSFISLAARTQAIYDAGKRQLFSADYNDLVSLALGALQKKDSAARRFYNHAIAEILVDEFQDTNHIQSTLLSLLAGPNTALFLIGDDKQSIYK